MTLREIEMIAGRTRRALSGFTLIELLVTIAVLSIIATVAVPNFQNMVVSNRLAADYNEIISSLNYARSEAAKRRKNVSFILSSNDNGAWEIEVSYIPKNSDSEDSKPVVAMNRKSRDGRVEVSPSGTIVFNALGRRSSCFDESSCVISVGDSPNEIAINLAGNVQKRPRP